MNTQKTLITGAIALAVLAPLATFAATSNTSTGATIREKFGMQRMHVGNFSGSGQTERLPFFGSGLTDAQKTELTTYFASVKTAQESMSKITLSDADKASLEAIRETANKAERDFLRSKGVTLPTEEAIASAKAILEANRPKDNDTDTNNTEKTKKGFVNIPGLGLGFGPEMGRGGPGGHGRMGCGRHMENDTNQAPETTSTSTSSPTAQ